MNTPDRTIHGNENENKQQDIERLEAQLVQNQLQRTQTRNYARILREYNTPAQWYKPSPITRSIYFYDPNYQKYLQQQSKLSISPRPTKINVRSIPPPIRVQERPVNQSNSQFRSKYPGDLHYSSRYHQQKQIIPSRLQSIPTLPPIITSNRRNDE